MHRSSVTKSHHDFPQIARESGFTLRKITEGVIEWKSIASFDPDRIYRSNDFENLDLCLELIAGAPLSPILQIGVLNPAVGNFISLAQFGIQYLVFCKEFLDQTVVDLRTVASENQKENVYLQRSIKRRSEELLALYKRLKGNEVQKQVSPCAECKKNTSNADLYQNLRKNSHATNDQTLIKTVKLELEIKQLRDRLLIAEQEISATKKNSSQKCLACIEKSTDKPSVNTLSIGIQSNLEENKECDELADHRPLFEDMKSEMKAFFHTTLTHLKEWKSDEKRKFGDELFSFKESIHTVLSEIKQSQSQSQSQKPSTDLAVQTSDVIENSDSNITPILSLENIEELLQKKNEEMENLVRKIENDFEKRAQDFQEQISVKFKDMIANNELQSHSLNPPKVDANTSESLDKRVAVARDVSLVRSCDSAPSLKQDLPRALEIVGEHETIKNKAPNTIVVQSKPLPTGQMVESIVERRLLKLGLNPKLRRISSTHRNNIQDNLDQNRELNWKKYRNYFIIRNKIIADVNRRTQAILQSGREQNSKLLQIESKIPVPEFKMRKSILYGFKESETNSNERIFDLTNHDQSHDDNISSSKDGEPIVSANQVFMSSTPTPILSYPLPSDNHVLSKNSTKLFYPDSNTDE